MGPAPLHVEQSHRDSQKNLPCLNGKTNLAKYPGRGAVPSRAASATETRPLVENRAMTQELRTTQAPPNPSPLPLAHKGRTKSNLFQIVSQEDKVDAAETQLSDDQEKSHYTPRKEKEKKDHLLARPYRNKSPLRLLGAALKQCSDAALPRA